MSPPAKWTAATLAAAALLGAAWLLCTATRPVTPEERIQAMFQEAARAAEQRKVDQVVEVLSARFSGSGYEEHINRDEARRLLAFELLRGQWVSVSISSAEVIVDGARAKANVDAVLSRAADRKKGLGSLLPGEASVHRFRLDLAEEEGEWRVISGSWRQIGIEEALSGPGAPDW
jgi:phosphoserine phosphatase